MVIESLPKARYNYPACTCTSRDYVIGVGVHLICNSYNLIPWDLADRNGGRSLSICQLNPKESSNNYFTIC